MEDAIAARGFEAEQHLREQHRLLRRRIEGDQELLAALEKEMEARNMGTSLTPEEQFEVFGTDKVGGQWADEAAGRWGDTDAYRESRRRTTRYTKADWLAIKAQADATLQAFADAMRSGAPADGDVAIMMVEAESTEATWDLVDGGAQAPTEEVVAQGLEPNRHRPRGTPLPDRRRAPKLPP